jgi:hypothetical protein
MSRAIEPNESRPKMRPRSRQMGCPLCQRHSPRRVSRSYSVILRAA